MKAKVKVGLAMLTSSALTTIGLGLWAAWDDRVARKAVASPRPVRACEPWCDCQCNLIACGCHSG